MKKGLALVTMIYIILVFSVMAVGFVYLLFSEARLGVSEQRHNRAFYIAEAGRTFALRKLIGYGDWTQEMGFSVTRAFDGGHFQLTTTGESANQLTLNSIGVLTLEGTTYVSRVRATIVRAGGGGLGDYALYAFAFPSGDGDANLGSNVIINGDIYVNADLVIGSNVTINGDASASGDVSLGINSSITGETSINVDPPADPPSLETTYYLQQIALAAASPYGNQSWGSRALSGTTYVNGNLSISNNANITLTGVATVVVTGTLNTNNNVNYGANLTLIAGGAVSIQNNVNIGANNTWYSNTGFNINNNADIGTVTVGSGTVFLTPGYFNISNNCDFYGLIFAGGTVSIGTNANITGTLIAGMIDVVGNNSVITLNQGVVDYGSIIGLSGGSMSGGSLCTVGWQEVN